MELTLPITIYWDLAPCTPLDDPLLLFCDEILECRPLMLQLYDSSPVLGEGVRAILERFRGTPVAVSLTVPYSCLSSLHGTSAQINRISELTKSFPAGKEQKMTSNSLIDELGVKELLLAFDSPESLRDIPGLPEVGLSFFVNRDNWREIPDVVSLCRDRGVNRLVLPMQRLFKGEEPFLLDRSGQGILESALAAIGGTGDLRLTIHDPFLWRAFNPGIPFPQGGCQAANTMIAISPDGGVYPCPTLPERLGKIGTTSLKEIITSPVKKELRSRILRYPAACSSCLEIAVCRGGCRGRSYVMHGSFDGIDDACQ